MKWGLFLAALSIWDRMYVSVDLTLYTWWDKGGSDLCPLVILGLKYSDWGTFPGFLRIWDRIMCQCKEYKVWDMGESDLSPLVILGLILGLFLAVWESGSGSRTYHWRNRAAILEDQGVKIQWKRLCLWLFVTLMAQTFFSWRRRRGGRGVRSLDLFYCLILSGFWTAWLF
jgi:hypothetical protein